MRIEALGEKASSYAIPSGVIVAAAVFFYWYVFAFSLENSLWRSVAVLIIAYPFILKRAVPAAFTSSMKRARRAGITFKDIASLENLNQASVVVFNKTGTLTVGKPEITDFVVFDDTLLLPEALHLAASLESKSAHPLARAIVEKGKTLARGLATPFEYKEVEGMGVSGVVNGKHIEIGNLSFLEGLAANVRGQDVGFSRFQNEGKTVVFMFMEKKLAALIACRDALRPFAKEAVAALTKMGKEVVLLTGDNKKTSEAVARQLDVKIIRAEVFPQDREHFIKELQEKGTARRTIAIVENNEIRVDTNTIMYARDNMRNVASAFAVSKKTVLIVKLIVVLQFMWYAVALTLAIFISW